MAAPARGPELAKELGWPDAPEGHVWVAGTEQPYLRRVDANDTSKLRYDVGAGRFVDANQANGARLGERRISQEIYNELRASTPNTAIQDSVNEGKIPPFPDEALPGFTVNKRLEADHIVPMARIVKMEGFDQLTFEQQLSVLNNSDNFIGLSRAANASKGSKTYAEWTMHQKSGTPVNPIFRSQMIQIEQDLELQLQQQIDNLVRKNDSK